MEKAALGLTILINSTIFNAQVILYFYNKVLELIYGIL